MKTKDTIEQNQKANLPVKSPTSFTSKTGGINKSQKLWTVHQTLLKTWTSNLPGLVDNVNKQSAKFCWQCEQTNFHTSFTSQNKRDQQKLGSVNHQSAIPPNSLGQRSRPNNPSTLCTCQGMVLFRFSWVNTCTDSSVPILPVCAQYTLTKLMMLEIPYLRIYQDMIDVLPCHIHLPVCLWILDPHSRAPKKSTSHGSEMLQQVTTHLIQRPCYQWESPCQDSAGNWTTQRPPDHCKETQTAVVWSCLSFIRSGHNHLARHSERGKKTRQTEEEVGRQHQGMDRPGVRQVPEGSREQGNMEKTGCEIICGAPTLAVKG